MRRLLLTFVVLGLGCASASDEPFEELEGVGGKADGLVALVDGTPRAVGTLSMVNASATTFEELDDEVPLDRRAAAAIVDGRPFGNVAELDAAYYVGAVAMHRLGNHAEATGWVPEGDELLGHYDGVAFTVDQADHALRLANEESDGVLAFEVGLHANAVAAIIDAREDGAIPSVLALSLVPHVGPASLRKLRDHNVPEAGAECRFDGDCPGGLTCVGFPHDGSSELGRCKDVSAVPGAGEHCESQADCGAGLVCSGLTVYDDGGYCRPAWMADEFHAPATLHIPSTTPNPIPGLIQVAGLASVPEDITVSVDVAYQPHSDLRVLLRDPNGHLAVVFDGSVDDPALLDGPIPVLDNPRDDAVNGRWLLWIYNDGESSVGTFHGWTLALTSRFD